MSDSKKGADQVEHDTVIDGAGMDEKGVETEVADNTSATAKPEKQPPAKKISGVWFLLLLLAAMIGGLQLTGQLQPLYASLQGQVTGQLGDSLSDPLGDQLTATSSPKTLVATPATTGLQPAPAALAGNLNLEPASTVASVGRMAPALQLSKASPVTPTPAVIKPSKPTITSEEVAELLLSIDQLRVAMQQLETSQHHLQNGLLEQQQMNRDVRLRWIADPASRLVQIQLAWEEISLLPGLTQQQRQQAVAMHTLARANVHRLQQWQGALSKWTDVLAMPLHANVLPKPEQAWLAWIVDQFQLRQAPTQEARKLTDLRNRLLDVARQLSLQSWPAQGLWQRLHAELLLHIQAMHPNQQDDTIDTGLPVDFTDIQDDIMNLRQVAASWLHHEMQGEML